VPRLLLPALLTCALAAGLAAAQSQTASERAALVLAKREAEEATRRSALLERQARAATNEVARTRADAAALAARIQAAEASITAAETRIRIIENLRAGQRARLARQQEPVVRLTAALQTMARRPPALALIQPGTLDDVVHVRSLLASTLPIIRERTSGVRAEIKAGNKLRRQAELAVETLAKSQNELQKQRVALARLEARQRQRSDSLAESAIFESDRALAFGEEARDLTELMGTLEYQSRLRRSLAALPGPLLRPAIPGQASSPQAGQSSEPATPPYRLPVEGRLVTGTGEISEAGVHARGLTFEPRAGAQVTAPAAGRIVYSGPFRAYGTIVIVDHDGGWTSLVTNLENATVKVGDAVELGSPIGRAGGGNRPRISVELRRNGRPVPIAPLLGRA
jgi:septal ring factor EnvC (AmiA/AmiB activator)